MARIIGDSYAGLQGTAYNYDALNASIQQRAAEQAQQNYQFGVQQQVAQARQAEEDARQANDEALRRQQMATSTDAQNRAEANAAYQFNASQAARAAENTTKHQEYEQGLDVTKQLSKDKESQRQGDKTQAQLDRDFQTALQLVDAGLLNEDNIDEDYGHLQSYQISSLKHAAQSRAGQILKSQSAPDAKAAEEAMAMGTGPKPAPKDAFAFSQRGIMWVPSAPGSSTGTYRAIHNQTPLVPSGATVVPGSDASAPADSGITNPAAWMDFLNAAASPAVTAAHYVFNRNRAPAEDVDHTESDSGPDAATAPAPVPVVTTKPTPVAAPTPFQSNSPMLNSLVNKGPNYYNPSGYNSATPTLNYVVDKLTGRYVPSTNAPPPYAGFQPSTNSPVAAPVQPKPLTQEAVKQFLKIASGDREKAKQLAREAGYVF